jgi:hypothetical protein
VRVNAAATPTPSAVPSNATSAGLGASVIVRSVGQSMLGSNLAVNVVTQRSRPGTRTPATSVSSVKGTIAAGSAWAVKSAPSAITAREKVTVMASLPEIWAGAPADPALLPVGCWPLGSTLVIRSGRRAMKAPLAGAGPTATSSSNSGSTAARDVIGGATALGPCL